MVGNWTFFFRLDVYPETWHHVFFCGASNKNGRLKIWSPNKNLSLELARNDLGVHFLEILTEVPFHWKKRSLLAPLFLWCQGAILIWTMPQELVAKCNESLGKQPVGVREKIF